MKILFLDIESAPMKAYAWGMWDQNIGANQVIASGYCLCWTAKWLGDRQMMHGSVRRGKPATMLHGIHRLLDEADVVVHYNGLKYDIPTLNKEFIQHGMTPPAPYKQLDLLRVARNVFRFQSNKLSAVSEALGIGHKIKTDFSLWVRCMEGDAKAWDRMERYNKMDVLLLERLYRKMLPWIGNHPNRSVEKGKLACPKCGSDSFHGEGTRVAKFRVYQRYQCNNCGGWFRGSEPLKTNSVRKHVGINIGE